MQEIPNLDFKGKYIIKCDLRTITALHIGGTEEGFEIGGIDNPVIKDKITGLPYIPGSSLKGKLRSLLEWIVERESGQTCAAYQINKFNKEREIIVKKITENSNEQEKKNFEDKLKSMKLNVNPCNCGKCDVCIVFGNSAETHTEGPTRLTVLDAWPDGLFDNTGNRVKEESNWGGTIKEWTDYMGERVYTELKTENTIDRITSAANPRSMERVPANSVFKAEFIYDVYQDEDIERLKILFEGMKLLEDSTLGGGGSRGSGRIRFENIDIEGRDVSYYKKGKIKKLNDVNRNNHKVTEAILADFDSIFSIKREKQ